jgi:lipopolysaccharide cholinephosphotransferase
MDFDTLFPDNREQGATLLRQSQLVMLRMLKILDYLCERHGIQYFLSGGTLLGAIRHKGFIPWDDDLDIGMTRANYEHFKKLVVPELPKDIFFQTPETDSEYPSCHLVEAKLRDKYSRYILADNQKSHTWHNGIMLDIFVYDRSFLPHNFFIYALNRSLMALYWGKGRNNTGNEKRAKALRLVSKLTPFPLVYASGFIRNRKMLKLGTNYYKKTEIEAPVRVPFEDMMAYVPQQWDDCLRRQYGNYMTLPPPEKQRGHFSEVPDPFHPCQHTEILYWDKRVVKTEQ